MTNNKPLKGVWLRICEGKLKNLIVSVCKHMHNGLIYIDYLISIFINLYSLSMQTSLSEIANWKISLSPKNTCFTAEIRLKTMNRRYETAERRQ